jgi:HJR/Mrr/RecB family endonuclease
MSVIQQLSNNNPQIQQLMQSIQGKNPQELEQYARNLAQSKGINLDQFLSQYGCRY